jgi:phage repressor protein C with HTH and peptisase S24 domain
MIADTMKTQAPAIAAEAKALKEAFQLRKKTEPKLTQEALAERLGFAGQSAVSQYLNGRIPLNLPALLAFAEALDFNPSDISPRLVPAGSILHRATSPTPQAAISEQPATYTLAPIEEWNDATPLGDDEVALPFFKGVELSAGNGSEVMLETGGHKLRFGARTLRKHRVRPDSAVAATVRGNSMTPVMPDGCTIAIDTDFPGITDGKIYALDHAGELRVKLLYRLPGGGLRIRSYNDAEYPDEIYSAEQAQQIRILGRVFWYSVML